MSIPDDPEALARALHDVAFAWNHTMPEWDSLRDEDRLWFTERARRMLAIEDAPEPDGTRMRRIVRSPQHPSLGFTAEELTAAVANASKVLPSAAEASDMMQRAFLPNRESQ